MATTVEKTVLKGPIPESGVYVDPGLMVPIYLPTNEDREEKDQFEIVSVNGKNYQVALGAHVEVPYEVFVALYNSGRYPRM